MLPCFLPFFFPFTSLLWFAHRLVRFYLLVLHGDLMELPILKLNFKTIKNSIPNTIQGGEKKNTKPKKIHKYIYNSIGVRMNVQGEVE